MAGKPLPVEPRFWAQVEKAGPDECWTWKGSTYPAGYGKICVYGKTRGTHRVSLWLAGAIDLDTYLYVLHSCDNRLCVNPAHLRAGTASENTTDGYARGRMVSQIDPARIVRGDDHPTRKRADLRQRISERQQGEKSCLAKLTETDVRQIFDMRVQRMTYGEIAAHFNVSREQIGGILRRRSWGHLTGLPEIPTRNTCGAWRD